MSNFAKGGNKAREAQKNAFPAFKRTNYLTLKDGESTILRLIDDADDWIFVNQHGFIPTKGAPKDAKAESKAKWPASMNAVCRYTKNEGDYVFPELAETGCFICDHMTNAETGKKLYPSVKLWARAIQRDEIKGTDAMVGTGPGTIRQNQVGRVVGFRDHEVEVQEVDGEGKATGKTFKEPKVIVLNQGMKNFFGALQAYADAYGTALDRDYKVTRRGNGLKTEYDIVAMDAIQGYSLEDPEIRTPYLKIVDLEKVITEQASDDHYARFFDTTKEAPSRASESKDEDDEAQGMTNYDPAKYRAGSEGDDEAQSTAPDPALLEGMRARLLGGSGADATQDA